MEKQIIREIENFAENALLCKRAACDASAARAIIRTGFICPLVEYTERGR